MLSDTTFSRRVSFSRVLSLLRGVYVSIRLPTPLTEYRQSFVVWASALRDSLKHSSHLTYLKITAIRSAKLRPILPQKNNDKAKPAERRGRKATGPRFLRDALPTTPRRTLRPPGCPQRSGLLLGSLVQTCECSTQADFPV